jgi:two-component system, OmpR family, response regulator
MEISKVLLVDDEPDIRKIGLMSLRAVGNWEATEADCGQSALDSLANEVPDLILLDVMMPGMDGPTTLAKLRENPDWVGIPVIFLTAKVQKNEVDRYLDLGARGVIAKPFDPMTLPDEVRKVLGS